MRPLVAAMVFYAVVDLVWGAYFAYNLLAFSSFSPGMLIYLRPLLAGVVFLILACVLENSKPAAVTTTLTLTGLVSLLSFGLVDAFFCLLFYQQYRAATRREETVQELGLTPSGDPVAPAPNPRRGLWSGLDWFCYLGAVGAWSFCGYWVGAGMDIQQPPSFLPNSILTVPLGVLAGLVLTPVLAWKLGMRVMLAVALLAAVAGRIFLEGQGPAPIHLVTARSHLKKLATALEMYASDNAGHYPRELPLLTQGNYLKSLDLEGTTVEYQVGVEPDAFTLTCRGRYKHGDEHSGMKVLGEKELIYSAEHGLLDPR